MAWRNRLIALGLASALLPTPALAADHLDGSATGVQADKSTDINDVYSWMSTDGTKIYLIMTVSPAADKAVAKFSTAAWYVFHTASRANFLAMQATPTDVVCGFNSDPAQKISCWVGSGNTNFVYGDATAAAGISSADGKIKVFAGARKDHFFFNLDGFNAVRTIVKTRTPAVTLDANGCAAVSAGNAMGLTATETMAVRNQLQRANGGAAGSAVDFFAQLNTLAIVVEIDKTLLTPGGPTFSVWGGTHKRM